MIESVEGFLIIMFATLFGFGMGLFSAHLMAVSG